MREKLKNCKRIIVKAGTSILTSRQGHFSEKNLARFGSQILTLMENKKQVVLVSSGAIGLGMEASGIHRRPQEMTRLQACAAIGQGKLMHAYERYFQKYGVHTAQLLLTRDGLESRDRFLNARRTLEELIRMKALPIINENDTIATEEIAFGDNDILSVQAAHLIQADLLIILSDVDGFYLKDGSRVRQVASEQEIDQELVKHLDDRKKQKTVGGMKAKLEAARIAMRLGVPLLIVNGHSEKVITKAIQGEDLGTLFLPGAKEKSARKKWIAFSAKRKGTLVVDEGACKALKAESRSLLARGILKLRGEFDSGDVVELEAENGKALGRGIVIYSSHALAKITGKKSDEIQAILGYKHGDEVIHRNNLVIWA